jgi:hypothetical protein
VSTLASGGLADGLGLGGGVAGLIEGFDQEGEGLKALLQVGEAGLDGVGGWVREGGFGEHVVDGGADEFGDISEAAGEAELAETLVFLAGEAEADHAGAGLDWH